MKISVIQLEVQMSKHGTAAAKKDVRMADPAFHPGGTPSMMDGIERVDVEV
jgi:hypothetical protein